MVSLGRGDEACFCGEEEELDTMLWKRERSVMKSPTTAAISSSGV